MMMVEVTQADRDAAQKFDIDLTVRLTGTQLNNLAGVLSKHRIASIEASSPEITQADRDAAASYYFSAGGSPDIRDAIRDRKKDEWFRVTKFSERGIKFTLHDVEMVALGMKADRAWVLNWLRTEGRRCGGPMLAMTLEGMA
jgi:hypothetical protein